MLEPAAQTLARYLGDSGEAISDLNSLYDQFALCFRWIELKPKRGPKLQGFALLQDGSVHIQKLDLMLSWFATAVRHAASVNPAFKPVNVDILKALRVAAVQVYVEGFQGEKRKTVTAAESDLLAVWVEFEETTALLREEIPCVMVRSEHENRQERNSAPPWTKGATKPEWQNANKKLTKAMWDRIRNDSKHRVKDHGRGRGPWSFRKDLCDENGLTPPNGFEEDIKSA